MVFYRAYQFGYEVGPNGQFHHETRGPDGVTYGCYGYIDPNGMLRVTHYVADSHGYRVVEPNRPVEIFSDSPAQYSNALTEDEPQFRHRGQLVAWRDLYLPRGCGMYPGGLRPDGPAVTPPPPTGAPTRPTNGGTNTGGGSGTGSPQGIIDIFVSDV
ncbi:AAEL011033-PA [Aedes aegypti]|uniref:AAEL011033-PA n=1 Tax=Aedes aegypti TaxID=7159 RepID=Q16RA0_AEDAE|nr:AAEL011033-PA [Aedes aegypti]